MVAESFEDLEADFESEDADSGLWIEPGSEEEDDRFNNSHPGIFTIAFWVVVLHGDFGFE